MAIAARQTAMCSQQPHAGARTSTRRCSKLNAPKNARSFINAQIARNSKTHHESCATCETACSLDLNKPTPLKAKKTPTTATPTSAELHIKSLQSATDLTMSATNAEKTRPQYFEISCDSATSSTQTCHQNWSW